MALQHGVGLGLFHNTAPRLLSPCSVSPFVYSHLSQVRGHVIQPYLKLIVRIKLSEACIGTTMTVESVKSLELT
jgi:hypothetical protein